MENSENEAYRDNVMLLEFLAGNGFMIPSVGDEKSGGGVVDSFTLMPS